jgi:hypothetical protein
MKKYNFTEFVAALEGENFDEIEPINLQWATETFGTISLKDQVHGGDCTKMPGTCYLCHLEDYLTQFHQYTFNENEFRKSLT